jgi:hypothetical protein
MGPVATGEPKPVPGVPSGMRGMSVPWPPSVMVTTWPGRTATVALMVPPAPPRPKVALLPPVAPTRSTVTAHTAPSAGTV